MTTGYSASSEREERHILQEFCHHPINPLLLMYEHLIAYLKVYNISQKKVSPMCGAGLISSYEIVNSIGNHQIIAHVKNLIWG